MGHQVLLRDKAVVPHQYGGEAVEREAKVH